MPPSSILFVIGVLSSLPAGGVVLPHSNPRLHEFIENRYGIEVITLSISENCLAK